VAIAAHDGRLLAAAPVSPSLRADPAAAPERGWLLVAALVGALVEAGAEPAPEAGAGPRMPAALAARPGADHELAALAALAFEEQVAPVDRLRARALVVPVDALPQDDAPRPPIGATHQLLVAAQVAALGGRPADPAAARSTRTRSSPSCSAAATPARPARTRTRSPRARGPPDPPAPGRHGQVGRLPHGVRPPVARLRGQRQEPAEDVGERLLAAGLLMEKPSVGQRHVYLNPRRARDIRALIEEARVPATCASATDVRHPGPPRGDTSRPMNIVDQVTTKLFTARTLIDARSCAPSAPTACCGRASRSPSGARRRPRATPPPRRAIPARSASSTSAAP
jgi:hypothetical protein